MTPEEALELKPGDLLVDSKRRSMMVEKVANGNVVCTRSSVCRPDQLERYSLIGNVNNPDRDVEIKHARFKDLALHGSYDIPGGKHILYHWHSCRAGKQLKLMIGPRSNCFGCIDAVTCKLYPRQSHLYGDLEHDSIDAAKAALVANALNHLKLVFDVDRIELEQTPDTTNTPKP